MIKLNSVLFVCLLLTLVQKGWCCDLEEYFAEKQVSVEESARDASVVFRGLSTNGAGGSGGDGSNGIGGADQPPPTHSGERGVYPAYFELISTYKGSDHLHLYSTNR